MRYLRKNTAVTVVIGPLVDWADGKTLLTDNATFDPSKLVCELVKNSTSQILTLSKTTGDNLINLTGTGMASLTLTAADTNTEGGLRLVLSNAISGGFSSDVILSIAEDFTVYGEGIYGAIFEDVTPVPPSLWAIDTTLRQNIWARAAIDLLAIFGEPIVYQPLNGELRSITAVINYDGIKKTDPMQQGHGPSMTVSVFNHAAYGITAVEVDTGGDVIIMPTRIGDTTKSRRITRIASQDEGMITLEVR